MKRVSTLDALLEVQRGFALREDDVSLTELRSSAWIEKLARSKKLRLLARNQTVGVVVDPAVWEVLETVAEDVLEDLLIDEAWGDRVGHERLPAGVAARRLLELLQEDERARGE
ncbi:MAG: hypothetical protein M0Z66_16495 [Thermaerobacter sp.]|nr:hypothetical protein [Thermaerobacter sp.]